MIWVKCLTDFCLLPLPSGLGSHVTFSPWSSLTVLAKMAVPTVTSFSSLHFSIDSDISIYAFIIFLFSVSCRLHEGNSFIYVYFLFLLYLQFIKEYLACRGTQYWVNEWMAGRMEGWMNEFFSPSCNVWHLIWSPGSSERLNNPTFEQSQYRQEQCW